MHSILTQAVVSVVHYFILTKIIMDISEESSREFDQETLRVGVRRCNKHVLGSFVREINKISVNCNQNSS
jgi:hypothetical protein